MRVTSRARRSNQFTCLHHSCAQPSLPHPPPSSLAYAQVAPLVDKRVELHGTSRADLDGKRGVATDFYYYKAAGSKCRCTVRLDGGEAAGKRSYCFTKTLKTAPRWPPMPPITLACFFSTSLYVTSARKAASRASQRSRTARAAPPSRRGGTGACRRPSARPPQSVARAAP